MQAGGGVRASFASEASFDPERGSSYAASLERRDGGGGMTDQPSFDPSQSSMFLQVRQPPLLSAVRICKHKTDLI